MIVQARNTLAIDAEKTFMTHVESAGTNVLRWKNPNVFAAQWAVQVGETGEEQSEIVLLGSDTPAGTAGTLAANTLYEHPADTPLYAIKYDQIVFEVSTAGTAGTAAPITDGTITIQPDAEYTQFDHTAGSSTYAYKTYFRSSALQVNSTESGWITPGGFSFYSKAKLRQRIKDKLWNSEFIKDDDVVDNWINEWLQEMVQVAVDVNEDYSLGTVDVAFSASGTPSEGLGTITNSDFTSIRRVWVTYNGADYYQAEKTEVNEILPDQVFNSTHPYFYMQGDSVFGIKPEESGGTARVIFYSSGTILSDDTDELPVYMRPYTKSFVDYGLAQALYKDGKTQAGERKEALAYNLRDRFRKELSPRSQSSTTMMEIRESLEDNIVF